MQIIIMTIHVLAALLLILIILLQKGQGGGLSGMFGGGSGMDDVLSTPSGGEYLKKATTTLAVIFFLTSIILAVQATRTPTLMQQRDMPAAPQNAPDTLPPMEEDEFPDPAPEEEGTNEPLPLETP